MTLVIPPYLLNAIHAHAASSYPDEGAGFILGTVQDAKRIARAVLPQANNFESSMRRRRYSISPQDMLQAEREAHAMGLEIIGIFHSHPDHPAMPSEYDREHSLPWFLYLITCVDGGRVIESRVWRLREDRSAFNEVPVDLETPIPCKETL